MNIFVSVNILIINDILLLFILFTYSSIKTFLRFLVTMLNICHYTDSFWLGVGSLLPSCDHTGASCVITAATAEGVWGNVQPGRCSHLHPPQLHSYHGAGQRFTD